MTIASRQVGEPVFFKANLNAQELASAAKSKMVAKDFEAILLSMIFEKFEESISKPDTLSPGDDTLRDLGAQQLAAAVSRAGGIGIAKLIAPYLHGPEASSAAI